MTDGEFNTFYNGGHTKGQRAKYSKYYSEQLCKDMKSKGILVYSVAFAAPDNAKKTLSDCATPNSKDIRYYFEANNAEELRTAFAKIATDVNKLRLSK